MYQTLYLSLSCSLQKACAFICNILCSFKRKILNLLYELHSIFQLLKSLTAQSRTMLLYRRNTHTLYEANMNVKYLKLIYKSVVYQYCLVHTPVLEGAGVVAAKCYCSQNFQCFLHNYSECHMAFYCSSLGVYTSICVIFSAFQQHYFL